MANFAVLHIEKCKPNAYALGRHIMREKIPDNADPSRTHLNRNIITPENNNLNRAIDERIRQGYKGKKSIRKDAVKAVSIIMSGSHEGMKELERTGKLNTWTSLAQSWLGQEFGAENVVSLSLHMDEKTPHLHAVVVPLTPDGRLSAKEVVGNREHLQQLQTSFYTSCGRLFGLHRGLKGSRARHTDIAEYYTLLQNRDKLAKAAEQELYRRQNRNRNTGQGFGV